MILLCGIPTERPLALVAAELEALGAPYRVLNQRRFATSELRFEVTDGAVTGMLALDATRLVLSDVRGVYTRTMDDRDLPELRDLPADHAGRARARALHDALMQWLEITSATVVNRAAPQASNGSKPHQAQLIRAAGLRVPETLVTSDPEAVLDFRARHGRVIYKSISGARSIVRELGDDDLRRLDAIAWCPVQFQAFVPGGDVRVHCVGGEAFATAIGSTSTDYRYAAREGDAVVLEAVDLDDELVQRCLDLTASLDLEFGGLDLRLDDDHEPVCFEVNPSPAFSFYEDATGQPIARAVARHLVAA